MSVRIAPSANGFDLIVDPVAQQFEEEGDTFETPVALSLFTDRRASAAELALFGLPPSANRGWPGDSFPETAGDAWGSLLWLLDRALRNDETLAHGKQFAEQALAWMVADGAAQRVTATATWIGSSSYMQLAIEIVKADSTRWNSYWNATTAKLLRTA